MKEVHCFSDFIKNYYILNQICKCKSKLENYSPQLAGKELGRQQGNSSTQQFSSQRKKKCFDFLDTQHSPKFFVIP